MSLARRLLTGLSAGLLGPTERQTLQVIALVDRSAQTQVWRTTAVPCRVYGQRKSFTLTDKVCR